MLLQSREFNLRPVHVGLVVDREALGQVFLLSISVNVLYVPISVTCPVQLHPVCCIEA